MNELMPIYKDLNFPNKTEFWEWLGKTTHKQIWFEDHGQDLREIRVADNGEILLCNLQSNVWVGRFVNLEELEVGKPISFYTPRLGGWNVMSFVIKSIA